MNSKWFSTLFAAMFVILALYQYPVRNRPDEPLAGLIFTESGNPLQALFQDLPPNSFENEQSLSTLRSDKCAAQSQSDQSLSSRLWGWMNPSPVLASSCTESPCGGHYMYFYTGFCEISCGSTWYNTHFSSPGQASYSDGWKWTGNIECSGCRCEEDWCYNP